MASAEEQAVVTRVGALACGGSEEAQKVQAPPTAGLSIGGLGLANFWSFKWLLPKKWAGQVHFLETRSTWQNTRTAACCDGAPPPVSIDARRGWAAILDAVRLTVH